jgi:hypothetical protein
MLTLDIDEEEYPIPADGKVGEEIEASVTEYIYDIGGVTIKNIRTIQETKHDK